MPFTRRDQRVPPLPLDQRSLLQDKMLASLTRPGRPTPNVFATLVRNEKVFESWLPFVQRMLAPGIPARWREITVLRVAYRCDSFYEWAQHRVLGREVGLTDDEVQDLRNPTPSAHWLGPEAALIRAVDEADEYNCWSDDLWLELQRHLREEEIIEVAMLIGQYYLVGFLLNSFGVQLEPHPT